MAAMEAHNLRFVRCPKCLQLLVEYPSIPVYRCGGCSTVLRAKNRGGPVTHADPGSGERTSSPCSVEGSPQNSKPICLDEQKVVSSNVPHSEGVVEGNISDGGKDDNSYGSVDPERNMPVGEGATPGELGGEENCHPLIDGNARNPQLLIKGEDDKGTEASSSVMLIENGQNIETSENENGEKGSGMDDANDASVGREVADVHTMAGEELGADSGNNMEGEIESVAEQTYSDSNGNQNMNCQEIQPYEGLHIGSYEDLIEELERSLSLSDDEEDFLDVVDSNGLNDALHNQFGSRRFLSGGKMNDDPRSDPHGRLIEELERSFGDVEEPFEEHYIAVADKDVADKIHGKEHDEDPQLRVDGSADACEGSMSSFDGGLIKSGQSFEQKELAAAGAKEKEEAPIEGDNKVDHVHGNGHVMVTNKKEEATIEGNNKVDCVHGHENVMVTNEVNAARIHENEDEKDLQYLDTESANPCEGSTSSFDDGHLKSGQCFQQNKLTIGDSKESEEDLAEGDSKIDCIHANEPVVVTNKDIAETILVNEHDMDPQYLDNESANLCEGVTSSFSDGHPNSGQNFEQQELTSDGTEEKKEGHMENDNTAICVQADDAASVTGFSSLSSERIHGKSPSFPTFDKKKEEISSQYRASLLRQGLSLDSEDFKSIQKFIESQMDGTSSSLSSGSPNQGDLVLKTSNKFKAVDQLERLKKMDDLRDQLNRLSSQKGLEKRYQKKGLEYQPRQLNSYDAEQQFQSVDADSIPSSCTLDSYYGHAKPPRYPPPNPFSPPHSCANCRFGHVQTHIPHSYDAWELNSYYQSSYAGSSVPDHDSLKSSFKEQKPVVRKHILRPLSGASPYTVCNSCFHLVQMPSDIYMSKRKIGKMQCGRCSKVIVLSVPAVTHTDGNFSKEVARKSSKPDDRTVARTESASYPVSVSEEYGPSFTRSFSTQAGSALDASQSSKKVSDSALHRLMGYDSASQLLRHSRAFERRSRVFDDGYESFESMVPVSSRVSRRKNK